MSGNMRKCISLGPAGTYGNNNQFAYDFEPTPGDFPNRRWFQETNTKWIRLWADWEKAQPTRGTSLDPIKNAVIRQIDRSLELANRDGLKVMLCMYRFPAWANGSDRNPDGTPKEPDPFQVPANVSTSSDWGNWLRFLYDRYKGDAWPRSITILEVVNEPNFQFHPQQMPAIAQKTVDMMRTAQAISQEFLHRLSIAGPALADRPTPTTGLTPWGDFIDEMAKSGFKAHSKFIWTHHNYYDVEEYTGSTTGVRDRLGWWTGYDEGEGPIVFATEGGGRLWNLGGEQSKQVDRVVSRFNYLRGQPQIGMQSNWMLMDTWKNNDAALRSSYETGGGPRQVYGPWGGLAPGWNDVSYFQHRTTLDGWTQWDPTICSKFRGHLEVFSVGLNEVLYNNWTIGNGWSGWNPMGIRCTSAPGSISINETSMSVFVASDNRQLWEKHWELNGGWSNWLFIGGTCMSDPAVASFNGDHMQLFFRGADGTLWHRWWWRNGGWSGWYQLVNEQVHDSPSAVSWAYGRVDVVWRNGTNVRHTYYENGWKGVGTLGAPGGQAIGAPEIVSWKPGRLDVICRGGDWRLWRRTFDRHWSNWEPIRDTENFQFSPGAVSPYPGQIDLVIQRDQHINHLSL